MASSSDSRKSHQLGDIPTDETVPLHPTKIFAIITPWGLRGRGIKILDLTNRMKISYEGLTAEFTRETKKIIKNSPLSPWLTANVTLFGRHMTIKNAKGDQVAKCDFPFTTLGTAMLSFSPDSQHPNQVLEIKPVGLGFRAASFISDDVTYLWKLDGKITANRFSLYKIMGNKKIRVGKYSRGWFCSPPGILVLDTMEVDEQFAVLAGLVALSERNAYG